MPAHLLHRAPKHDDPEARLRELVAAHQKRKEEPLELAVWYAPKRAKKCDLYLFEVLSGFGGSEPDRTRKLLHVTFGSTAGFPLPNGGELHLVLTSPEELTVAIADGWTSLSPMVDSKRARTATVLFKSTLGDKLWKKMT